MAEDMRDWSYEEIKKLRRLYGSNSDEDIAALLGRTVEDVFAKAKEECLAKDKVYLKKLGDEYRAKMPRWGDEEVKVLREMYGNHSNLEIAKRLSRTVSAVVHKARKLKLRKHKRYLRKMGKFYIARRWGNRDEKMAAEG